MILPVPNFIFGVLWIILLIETMLLIGIFLNEIPFFQRIRPDGAQKRIADIFIGFSLSFLFSAVLLAFDKLTPNYTDSYWWIVFITGLGFGVGLLILIGYMIFFHRNGDNI